MVGIGETIKNVFSSDDQHTDAAQNKGLAHSNSKTSVGHNRGVSDASGYSASSQEPLSSDSDNETRHKTGMNTSGNKLRSGTGVGTSGHVAHEARPAGGLSGTGDKVPVASAAGLAANKMAGSHNTNRTGGTMPAQQGGMASGMSGNHEGSTAPREGGLFKGLHEHGHNKLSTGAEGIHIPGQAEHDTNQLQHVTHENVRHVETEEVTRQKEHDRHVHHVKHHVQPVVHKEVRDEEHHEKVHPVTRINEKHSSKDEDTTFLTEQVKQHKDTLAHAPKERTVIDKGTVVNEKVHHHVHHVVQPVIEQETVDRHRIHTVIPVHQTTHEAPVIHHTEAHAPVSMDAFVKSGGALKGAAGHESIANKVLHGGGCERQVDGEGENLAQKLHLGGTKTDERRI